VTGKLPALMLYAMMGITLAALTGELIARALHHLN